MVADMEADKEDDKVANMVADQKEEEKKGHATRRRKKDTQFGERVCKKGEKVIGCPIWRESWSRGLINWDQTCSTRTFPDLRVF